MNSIELFPPLQLWYEVMRDIRKGEELVLGPKVPLQIRDMCNNTNIFGLGLNGFMRDDRSDRESGKLIFEQSTCMDLVKQLFPLGMFLKIFSIL